MKTELLNNLFIEKILKKEKNTYIKDKTFYLKDFTTPESQNIKLFYKIGNKEYNVERKNIKEDIEFTLENMKKELICKITYDDFVNIILRYEKLLDKLKNSEGWYKYKTAGEYLIKEKEEKLNIEDKLFLEEYLSLCK